MPKKYIMEATSSQKLISFLSEEPGAYYTPTEAINSTKMSRRAFFSSIKDLQAQGYVLAESRGRFVQYAVDYKNPFIKQVKVLKNINTLTKLLEELKPVSQKLILFGSAARGDDVAKSDLDLFIITQNPDKAGVIVKEFKGSRHIHAVIKTPSEMPDFSEKETIFNKEVQKGIVLWEAV
jgi:predicted nucleotidyltransferase